MVEAAHPRMPPQPGSCHVWWARSTNASPLLATLLDDGEQRRLAALRRTADRDRFVVGCGLLRLALAGYLAQPPAAISVSRACQRCGEPHGKPRLVPPSPGGLEFSVSHSGDRVIVAFAPGTPLGVDVEQVRPDLAVDEMAPQVLTPSEAQALACVDPGERTWAFFVYWTRKEAVVKATGRGLAIPLQHLAVSGPYEPPRLVAWPQSLRIAQGMALHDLNSDPGYVASLAVIGQCDRVLARDGSALIASWLAERGADHSGSR